MRHKVEIDQPKSAHPHDHIKPPTKSQAEFVAPTPVGGLDVLCEPGSIWRMLMGMESPDNRREADDSYRAL